MTSSRVVLITGGGRGLGAALCRVFAEEGDHVIISNRSLEPAQKLAGVIQNEGGFAEALAMDVTRREDVARGVAQVLHNHGRIDVLVNNAGLGIYAPLAEITDDDFDTVLNTNLRGTYLMTQAVAPAMINQGGGHIVQIASVAGIKGFAGFAPYSASKFAVIGFMESVAHELRPHKVTVSIICPGGIQTEFSKTSNVPPGVFPDALPDEKLMSAKEVAEVALFTTRAGKSLVINRLEMRPLEQST